MLVQQQHVDYQLVGLVFFLLVMKAVDVKFTGNSLNVTNHVVSD